MKRTLLLGMSWLCSSLMLAHTLPVFAAEDWQLSFDGSHRTRFSNLENPFRPGLSGSDQALSLRTLANVRASRGPFSLVAELQDSRDYLNDSGSFLTTIEINAFEPLQAYVAVGLINTFMQDDNLSLKAGRFTLDLGSQRQIARHGWRNTIQNYSGIQADWRSQGETELTTFWVKPVSIRPSNARELLDNRIRLDNADDSPNLWGVFLEQGLGQTGLTLESYLFALKEEDRSESPRTADRELYSTGLRLLKPPAANAWDMELELIYQFGDRRSTTSPADTDTLDISASQLHVEFGHTFVTSGQPRLALELTRATGESNPADNSYGRFDSLYGPRREYGPTGIYGLHGRNNMNSAALRLTMNISADTDVMVSLRHSKLDSATDSFASTGVRDITGLSGKQAGMQFEFRVRHWLVAQKLRLEAGGAVFNNGSFFDKAPNATGEGDPRFFYTDFNWFF